MDDSVEVVGSIADSAPVGNFLFASELVPAGWPSPAQDYYDGDLDFHEHLILNRNKTSVIRITGESMLGVGIYDGDELIIDRGLVARNHDVVAALIDGELTVKTLVLTGSGPQLHPANPAYSVIMPHSLDIWGVATVCLHIFRRQHRGSIGEDLDLNQYLIFNEPATFVLRVTGDSMNGVGIYDSDELIVDRSLEPLNGDVVIAVIDGELTVKTLVLTGSSVELHPANPNYPILYPHDLNVWGIVTTSLHRLRQ